MGVIVLLNHNINLLCSLKSQIFSVGLAFVLTKKVIKYLELTKIVNYFDLIQQNFCL